MSERTKSVEVWCDNVHQPVRMFFSHDTAFAQDSIYKCGLCHAEKIVKESPFTGELKIEWKEKPPYKK